MVNYNDGVDYYCEVIQYIQVRNGYIINRSPVSKNYGSHSFQPGRNFIGRSLAGPRYRFPVTGLKIGGCKGYKLERDR